jgi:hypothetical protein
LALSFKQQVVVLPELALRAGRFRSLSRFLRVGVDAVEREMTVYDLNIFGVSVYQTL